MPLERVGHEGRETSIETDPAERAALAERMAIPAVLSLACSFHLTPHDDGRIAARGRLRARVTRVCVVSAEEFDMDVDERFRVDFVPSGTESEDDVPDSVDEIPYDGRSIDLGEAAAEQLGLALDPYPRMPGAEMPDLGEADPNPFAALGRLRRPS